MEKRNILPPLRASITTPRGVFPNLVGGGMGMASKTLSCLLITTKVHISTYQFIPVHTSTYLVSGKTTAEEQFESQNMMRIVVTLENINIIVKISSG